MSQIQAPRGTRDLLPADKIKYRFIEGTAFSIAKTYDFSEIETPIFEFSNIFHRSLGESSDMVSKETYDFQDRGGEALTLRPEGTAGVARAFVSEGLAQLLPLKFYYSGPMFRYERPQKGRYRQFYQLGTEYLGVESPHADVEVLSLAWDFLKALGIEKQCRLDINTLGDRESRSRYRDRLVEYFSKYQADLSSDSQIRLQKNPLRILDSKDEKDKKIVAGAPSFESDLNDSSKIFFDKVLQGLSQLQIDFSLNQKLVRGIDYYCHSVFEFVTDSLGAQGTVLAGGRYDGLIESMGGPKTPGVGWAAGIDRLMDMLPIDRLPKSAIKIAMIPADAIGENAVLKLARIFRQKNMPCDVIWNGNMGKKMKKAAGSGANYAVIVGEQEVKNQNLAIKNLSSGEQKTISINDLDKLFFSANF